jgi:hypothetical protein
MPDYGLGREPTMATTLDRSNAARRWEDFTHGPGRLVVRNLRQWAVALDVDPGAFADWVKQALVEERAKLSPPA